MGIIPRNSRLFLEYSRNSLNFFVREAVQKGGLTKVVHLPWKLVFSTFPIGAKRKNTLGIELHEVGFIPPFWVGFTKQRKTPGWRRSSNCVQNSFFRLSPSGRNEKAPLGSISTRSVSYHHFGWALRSSGKRRDDEVLPIGLKTRFFDFPHRSETKKHTWHRIPRGRFYTTILGWTYQEAEKAGLTKVFQLGWKLVLSSSPIRGKQKKTRGIEFHEVGFIPPFFLGFCMQCKKPGWRRSSNCVENSFRRVSPSGRNEKTPLGSNSTRSVSYHYFCWALPSSGKRWVAKVVQLRSKLVLSSFPIGAKRKNTLGFEFHEVGFIPPFLLGFTKQRKTPGWRRSSNCVQNSFCRVSPSVPNEKTPLRSNSTRSVSYHHFGWDLQRSGKRLVDEGRPIVLKTRFFEFPHMGE